MPERRTILPPTATDLTKALDRLEERLFDLPVSMINKRPADIPVGALDHLAWEHSVDVWDSDWPEDVKRAVVELAAEVHRHKGTPYALKAALSALAVRSEVEEWWQSDPEGVPGTYIVRAYVTRELYADEPVYIPDRFINALIAAIQRVGPVSRGFELRIGAGLTPQPMTVSAGARGLSRPRADLAVVQVPIHAERGCGVASAGTASSAMRGDMRAGLGPIIGSVSRSLAAGARGRHRLSLDLAVAEP